MKGRYGPYVTDGSTNATVRDGIEPESVTLDQALALIAERVAKGGGPKKKNGAKAKKPAKAKTAKAKAEKPAEAAPQTKKKKTAKAKKPEPVPGE